MSIKGFFRDRKGTVAVEFALLFMVLFVLSMGIVEFGRALYEWHKAEKALQIAARFAVVTDPVATDLRTWSAKDNSNEFGDSCRDPATGGIQSYCDFAPIICTNAGCTDKGFSSSAFNAIFQKVQPWFPALQPENLVVEYRATNLGFVGRPGARTGEFNLVPAVTIRLRNIQYDFMVLDDLLGIGPVVMPEFTTTLIAEDLSNVVD